MDENGFMTTYEKIENPVRPVDLGPDFEFSIFPQSGLGPPLLFCKRLNYVTGKIPIRRCFDNGDIDVNVSYTRDPRPWTQDPSTQLIFVVITYWGPPL
jgi:hypothetical protein